MPPSVDFADVREWRLASCPGTTTGLVPSRDADAAAWLFALLSVAPVPLLFRWPLWAWRLSVLGLLVSTFDAPSGGPPWSATNILVSGLALIVIATRVEPTVAYGSAC